MVNSIQPQTLGVGLLNTAAQRAGEAGRARAEGEAAADPRAAAAQGSMAELTLVRESIWRAVGALELAVGVGREAQSTLKDIQTLAAGQPLDAEGLNAALARYREQLEQGVADGAVSLAGELVRTLADPQGGIIDVAGEDVRLTGPLAALAQGATLAQPQDAPAILRLVDDLGGRLDAAVERFSSAAGRLVSHEATLGRLEAAGPSGAKASLDEETARLTALQVRQGLVEYGQSIGGGASSILSLFRAG